MDPFVAQLAELCTAHVTRAKWVFVPSHAIGRTLGERIALDGTNWLNLRFVTPLDIALRMGAPFLVERGIEPSEEGLGPALIMRLLLDLPQEGGHFRPLADQPTMAQALNATVRELRMAGVKSADLRAAAFESPQKHAELRALLATYERFLADNKRGDMAAVYEEALEHPAWCPIQKDDCWTELPDVVWPPLQRRLIDAMPGERIAPRTLQIAGAAIPRRVAGRVRLQPDLTTNPLAYLLNPGTTKLPTLDLFHAGGREAEIEEVFRRILASGAPLDQVEIACATDAHVALVWEKALRHEWPIALGPGISAPSTRPGRALIGFCDWIETDFSAGHLRRLLQSGDMGIEEDDEGFTAADAARTITRAQAGWGRATYGLSLGLLQKSYDTRANDPDLSDVERAEAQAKATLTGNVARWITGLIARMPEPASDRKVPLQDVVDVALAFVERSTSRNSQLDHYAAAALLDYIGELRALGTFRCSLMEALRFVRERVESLQVAPERPRPGHLFASRLQHAADAGRAHVFVVGLEEGRVFPGATEDAVLLDAERASIAPSLRLSADRIDEAVYCVLSRLAAWDGRVRDSGLNDTQALQHETRTTNHETRTTNHEPRTTNHEPRTTARVTFSYSCRDTREFRETYPSWLVLQAYRLQQGNATRSYQQMKTALGEPVSIVPRAREAATTDAAWWLRSVVGSNGTGIDVVEASFKGVAQGRAAEAHRATSSFTEYDGHVPAAGTILDPCAPAHALSVTDLESAAGCPYRFFLKRGLGVRPIDEDERDQDVWIDPLTRGSELHAIYAALLRRCRDARRSPSVQKDGAWLKQLAQQTLDRLNVEMPPATAEILERESADFLADVELFLEGECEPSTSTPVALEVSFGRPLGEDEEELAREEPVDVDLGAGLKLRIAGRIDRIDRVGPDVFEIVDYKTGNCWRKDWLGVFNGGRRLQHALYGLAAVELLRTRHKKAKVARAVYYFPTHKGGRERVPIPAPTRAQVAAVLADLREVILGGAFIHATEKDSCRWCDFTAACGEHAHGRAEGKLADGKLKAYVRLAEHE